MRVETRDPLIGTVLDRRFRIDERVASGGFGVIYRATHVRSGYQVALKVLHPAMASDPDMVARFRLEAATLTTLRNPHTVTTYELVESGGLLFMVMELLRGESLLQRFRRVGPLPWKSVVAIGRAVCDSLAEAHALGVVHRDLKPENIHLEPQPTEDFVKVLDFGIAKLMQGGAEITKHNEVVGTFDYVSPEQVANEAYTGRSDIYTLGVVMYEMLTGSRPFGHATGAALLATILTTAPTAPSIRLPGLPPALDAVILRCLDKSPARRYPDVGALVTDLAPFGGPSGRAIAGTVQRLLHGSASAAAPVTPLARTAAASVAHIAPLPPVATAAPSVPRFAALPAPPGPPRGHAADGFGSLPGEPATAPPTPYGTATSDLVARTRRRPWWWITVPLIVVASASTAVICSRRDTTTPTPGPAAVVAVHEPAAPAALEAGAAGPSPLAPADAGTPWWVPPENTPGDARPKDTRPREPRPRETHASGADPKAARARDAATRTVAPERGGHESTRSTIAGSVADTAREAKQTCLESAADTPWNTAMCWCSKKDKARAQAFYARLSGFKRATVRTWCAARGIDLTP